MMDFNTFFVLFLNRMNFHDYAFIRMRIMDKECQQKKTFHEISKPWLVVEVNLKLVSCLNFRLLVNMPKGKVLVDGHWFEPVGNRCLLQFE